ncbi:MAG: YbaB/EbfC family nucleoid-associated protein [Propionibacteriales bacterium]|nr:YbaB/EbfC family nucleoid-associated protein [Propionibacteriales bacterium]
MFPDGTPDMQSLLEQAAIMQQQLIDAQAQLSEARIEGTAGGGAVKATVSGTGDLVGLIIDPSVCDPADVDMLADLVLAAVHDAAANAERLAAERMGELTGGLDDASAAPGQLGF